MIVLDCSEYQKIITVRPEVDAYILRVSHGHTEDPYFRANVARVRAAGKRLGYYHYYEGGTGEAAFFVSIVKKFWRTGDIYPVIDYEGVKVLDLATAEMLTNTVKAAFGGAGLYSGDYLLRHSGTPSASLVDKLWVWDADYGATPSPLPGYGQWDLHQYADTYKGVSQDVSSGPMTRAISHAPKAPPPPPPAHYLDTVLGTKVVSHVRYGSGRVRAYLGSNAVLNWLAKGAIIKKK